MSGRFVAVAKSGDVVENRVFCALAEGRGVVLVRLDGTVHALENRCSHGESSFEKGRVRAHKLLCPLHGGIFDVRDGSVIGPPAMKPIATYPAREVDGVVEVAFDLAG